MLKYHLIQFNWINDGTSSWPAALRLTFDDEQNTAKFDKQKLKKCI